MPRNLKAAAAVTGLLLVVIALVQVLPQVDLPDTAFHENDAPAVMKFRFLKVPGVARAIVAAAITIPWSLAVKLYVPRDRWIGDPPIAVHSIAVPFSTLLC